MRAGQEVFEAEIIKSGFRKVDEVKDVLKENYMVIFEVDAALQLGRVRRCSIRSWRVSVEWFPSQMPSILRCQA